MTLTENKIYTLSQIKAEIQHWRLTSKTIVFTNGCFDLLHFGHIDYLEKAKALGNKLIVGVNADASVQRLKGIHRPIQDQTSRLRVLAALQAVDAVVLFEEDTPLELIQILQPDILVKGGDYKAEDVVGKQWVKEVQIIPFVDGYSTSLIEKKIKNI